MEQDIILEIINICLDSIEYIRQQNYSAGMRKYRELVDIIDHIPEVRKFFLQDSSCFGLLLDALDKQDAILLADIIEEGVIPELKRCLLYNDSVELERYRLEMTSSGMWTVYDKTQCLYLHSNCNPREDAKKWVDLCFNPNASVYAVWGSGLGYHIERLYELSNGTIEIYVFEEDIKLLKIIEDKKFLSGIPKEKLHLIEDPLAKKFSQTIGIDNCGILLHYPSIRKIINKEINGTMNDFFADWNGTIQFKNELLINFRENEKYCQYTVDDLKPVIAGKEVVIVAGGPSVDDNIEFLKNSCKGKILIAVNTIIRKLVDLDIFPNYMIAMDSRSILGKDIENFQRKEIDLIVDSTACWMMAARMEGNKYIAYQHQFQAAERRAYEKNLNLYDTGGSVTTLALDIALKLGAKRIYLVGVDMAFPNGETHARGVWKRNSINCEGMNEVMSVNGDKVYADGLFVAYRKWIEKKISEYPSIKCYNMSKSGAYIKGTYKYEETDK